VAIMVLAVVAQAADLPSTVNSVGMKLIGVPAGEFVMGSPADEKGREEDEAAHRVRISRPFFIATMEVTGAQFASVMGRAKPENGDLPMAEVSWADAVTFCKRLSQKEGAIYRLPTEAEWEYACRAGSVGRFSGSDRLDDLAWFDGNAEGGPHTGGAKKPNFWGLYDMHGDLAEWCADYYAPTYAAGEVTDPAGPATGKSRVIRGGSFGSFERGCRCASRSSAPESYQLKTVGFRVVLEPLGQARLLKTDD
jgi:formylglycine-generating enzyme